MEKLTNKEEEIMQVLWQLKKGFVKDVVALLPNEPHYNTVSTTIRKMEEKGYIEHKAYGKTHEYFPSISKEDYRKGFMNKTINNYFEGIFFKVCTRKSQNISTVLIFTISSGECGFLMVGPKEMRSISG